MKLYMMKMKKGNINMNILFFCLGTIGITYGIILLLEISAYKYLANEGYKYKKIINSEFDVEFILITFLPIFNILFVFIMLLVFLSTKSLKELDGLINTDYLEKMTDLEKEEYKKLPIGINAMLVPKRVEKRLNKAMILLYRKNKETSKILFEYNDSPRKIKILKISGPLFKFSAEEQELIIIKAIEKAVASEIMEIGRKSFKKELKNGSYRLIYDEDEEMEY